MTDFTDQLKDDLDIFINPEEFAPDITYVGVLENSTVVIPAIYDTPFADDGTGKMILQSDQPTIRVKEHELPGLKVRPGDYVTIETIDYLCKESQPDGVGTVTILLKAK